MMLNCRLLLALVALSISPILVLGQGPRWEAMDYGPFLSASIEVDEGNIACKGLAIPLGTAPGGEATMLFDMDLLRWAAGWRGDGVALKGIVYDGPHGVHPGIDGEPDWVSSVRPGLSTDGDFADIRPWRYGQWAPGRARWNGVMVDGRDVALSYGLGRTSLMDVPGLIVEGDLPIYTRTIQVSGDDPDCLIELFRTSRNSNLIKMDHPDLTAEDRFGVVVQQSSRPVMAIGIVQPVGSDARVLHQDEDIRLLVHPDEQPTSAIYQVLIAPVGTDGDLDAFASVLSAMGTIVSLSRFESPPPVTSLPTVETAGQLNVNPGRSQDVMEIKIPAGQPARDISLKAQAGSNFAVIGASGQERNAADVPVNDSHVVARSPEVSIESRPVAYWKFDEGSGDAMRNEVNGKRDLLLDGVTWRRGLLGRCLDFDGTARALWEGDRRMPFTSSDQTFSAWIATRSDGTIMSKTRPEGPWVPDGVTFFVRDGCLAFDVGWVGVVEGSTRIDDGAWHHVAFTWQKDGRVRLYVDGREDNSGFLPLDEAVDGAVVQLGFTAEDFPNPSSFSGYMEGVQIHAGVLTLDQLREIAAQTGAPLVQAWVIRGDLPGATWRREGNGEIRLHVPRESVRQQADLMTWRGPESSLADALQRLKGIQRPGESAFAIDHITRPIENPSNSWMRFGALDLLPQANASLVTTWSGDVWLVEGLDADLEDIQWTRIASGLNQPFGISVQDNNDVLVLGRDQVTSLRDVNEDRLIDHYVNFNNETMNTEHFHEPASGLQRDAEGNLYYVKAARHAKDALHPHHGTLIRIPADGSESEVIASGFRAPMGLTVDGGGVYFCSDQEGHWMPANRINRIEEGGFYGNNWTGTPMEDRQTYDPPLVWIHPSVDRSPSSQVRVPGTGWGDLNGRLLGMSYGTGRVYLILEDEVDGVHQGGVVPLPIQVPTGLLAGRFNPIDGHLYLCGLVGWSSDAKEDGGLYRVRSTGSLPLLPLEVKAVKDGLVLEFTHPLEPEAAMPEFWDLQAWNYRWSEQYGSPEFALDGSKGRTTLPIKRVVLSPDRRTAWLVVPTMTPAMQMHLDYAVPSDGGSQEGQAHLTVHTLRQESGRTHVTP
ncbi:MAG: hypothetical protein CMJ29_08775 [Phycisphaerae bacterium]|nr:hypothetical protein [Phycisphaerae bacterium]